MLAVTTMVAACSMLPGGGNGGGRIAISPTPVNIDSVPQSLKAFRGKVVILNIWATWCGPCRVEIPDFIKLQNKYRDQGLEIVGLSIDPIDARGGGAKAVGPFMQRYGINYTIWMINNISALGQYHVGSGIPTTYVLDRDGRAVRTYVGVRPLSVFENDVKRLL
jgi:cytochrome c biogenesis protein CcmG/thiol:disulfide interchange protein DsbE